MMLDHINQIHDPNNHFIDQTHNWIVEITITKDYYNMRYSKLIEMLMEAENKKMLILSNNFGNRHIEMTNYPYQDLLRQYYVGEEN